MFAITKVIVLHYRDRADHIYLATDLPSPLTYTDKAPVSLGFEATKDHGEDYVARNFPGIPVEIVNAN